MTTTPCDEVDDETFYAPLRDASDGSYKFLCDGEWRSASAAADHPAGASSRRPNVVTNANPSRSNAPAFSFQACTADDVDEAYERAKMAHKRWARTPLHERAAALHRAAALMRAHWKPIADALVIEARSIHWSPYDPVSVVNANP